MSVRQTIEKRMYRWMAAGASAIVIALMLGSCQGGNVLVDEEFVGENAPRAIGFENSFIDRSAATRVGAPVALSDYASTMGVWGWRSDNNVTDEPQFLDQLVEYNPAETKWQYSPLRYWERNSTYRFYAYTPHQSEADAAVTINAATGHISISSVALVGTNLQNPATASQKYIFSAAGGDVDWIVARAGRHLPGRLGQIVDFTMQHILAKMNVAVRVSNALAADVDLTGVTVDSLFIRPFVAAGDFAQLLDHTPDATVAADRAAAEWTLTGPAKLTLSSAEDTKVRNLSESSDGTTYLYILESLVLPQDVTDAQLVKLCYTLTFSDGRTEHYTYVMPLTDAFGPATQAGGQLLSGYSYTLRFIIGPEVITFDSGVDEWTNQIDATKQVN